MKKRIRKAVSVLLLLVMVCGAAFTWAPLTVMAEDESYELEIAAEDDAVMAQTFDAIVEPMATGYGSGGQFLLPIETPVSGSIPIYNIAGLQSINYNLSGNYHLTADIDLYGWEWEPIGDNNNDFIGIFDGQGYVIRNLTITGDHQYTGLFGCVFDATIKNVGMEGTFIDVTDINHAYAGGICGENYYGDISNCYNTGTVSVFSDYGAAYAGGINGRANFTSISNCYNAGTVSASTSSNYSACAGGICVGGNVSACYNTGAVSASAVATWAGGIIGYTSQSYISNCYNTGSVSISAFSPFDAYIGAICGINSGTISDSYWMLESDQKKNGFLLSETNKGQVGDKAFAIEGRLTDAQMKNAANFTGFDFDNVWDISPTKYGGYPFLRDLPPEGNGSVIPQIPVITITSESALATNVTAGSISGSLSVTAIVTQGAGLSYQWYSNTTDSNTGGTEIPGETSPTFVIPTDLTPETYYYFCEVSATGGASPQRSNVAAVIVRAQGSGDEGGYGANGKFLAPIESPIAGSIPVSDRAELEAIKNNLSGKYHLTQDIDLSGAEWTPIGDGDNRFRGVFDGQGHVIRNLTITGEDNEDNGLFGYCNNAIIKNIGLEDTIIHVNRNIPDAPVCAGGISGVSTSSTISNCYNTGYISSFSYNNESSAGGICGSYDGDIISNCYNTGYISSSSSREGAYVGGICGEYFGSAISNCYNAGVISASFSADEPFLNGALAGGICGFIHWIYGSSYTVSNCYNTGAVSASSDNQSAFAGGISASPYVDSSFQNCFNTGSISASSDNYFAFAGGIGGHSYDSSISNCYNTGAVSVSAYPLNAYIGGICGMNEGTIDNSYWRFESDQIMNDFLLSDANKGQVGDKAGAIEGRLTETQMKNAANYTGFDFDNVWDISPAKNGGYPFLKDLPPDENGGGVTQIPVIIITTEPAPTTNVATGSISGSLSVNAIVTQGTGLSYQWYSNTSNSITTGTAMPDGKSAVYNIPVNLSVGTYYYYCAVSASGATPVYSSVATVTVSGFQGDKGKGIDEIVEMAKALPHSGFDSKKQTRYNEPPSLTAPYYAGSLNSDDLDDALTTLKMIRYLAGVPYDISFNDNLNNSAQHKAVLVDVSEFSHNPSKPAEMSEEFFQAAAPHGAESLAGGDTNISNALLGLVADPGDNNIAAVGHRMHLLNSAIKTYGVGHVKYITAVHSASSAAPSDTYIAWPSSGCFPIQYFVNNLYINSTPDFPWSLYLGYAYQAPVKNNITLTLTRNRDNKVWTFDENTVNLGNSTYGYENWTTDHLAVSGRTITFRPGLITLGPIRDGDIFHVLLTGIKTASGAGTTLEYDIKFFDLEKEMNRSSITITLKDGVIPLQGAEATIDGQTLATDENGIVSFRVDNNKIYNYVVSMEGYATKAGNISVGTSGVSMDVPMEELAHEPGDANGDGKINMQDVLLIYQSFRGKIIFSGEQIEAADVNGDGNVNMVDVLMVYQYFRGIITEFPTS